VKAVILCTLLGLLTSCGYHLGPPRVEYGTAKAMALTHPANDSKRWYIPALLADTSGMFFVDSGFAYTTCDDGLVETLGLKTRGRVLIHGELGNLWATTARLPDLNIGGHRVKGLNCIVRDLNTTSSIRDTKEAPIWGVVGIDVLRRFRVRFRRHHLELLDPSGEPSLPRRGDGIVALGREMGLGIRATVALKLATKNHRLLIDTGATRTYLDPRQARLPLKHEVESEVRGTGKESSNVRIVRIFSAPDALLAGHTLHDLTIVERRKGRWAPGLLGLDVLSRFAAEYDFRTRRAKFEPIAPIKPVKWSKLDEDDLSGISE
jgi:hypothetical protein